MGRIFRLGIAALACVFLFGRSSADSLAADPQRWLDYFRHEVGRIQKATLDELATVDKSNLSAKQRVWREELRQMLGIASLEKSELKSTTVGSVSVDGVSVDRLHYQALPGLFVGANLYHPQGQEMPAKGWPAVLYVCGHARVEDHGRLLGNKTSYQHHGLWLARHGVVCLIIDTVQLGEFHGEHHGTYKLGRWDWISRGFTPAGVEAWNAIRGIDLLTSLPDVNAEQIGITGRSGGGAYSWFAAALDERIKVAVPVAGITDLQNHVIDGCVEGHCDCMYFCNYYGWDYAKLAALVAPRGLLLANSDRDGIFPLDGVMRIDEPLRQLYSRLDADDAYGVVITPGPHKDTQELQVPAFRWLLKHLTGVEPIIDSAALKELAPKQLAVFEHEIPNTETVTSASSWFVPLAKSETDPSQAALLWKNEWLPQLMRLGLFPKDIPEIEFQEVARDDSGQKPWTLLEAQAPGAAIQILRIDGPNRGAHPAVLHAIVHDQSAWNAGNIADVLSDAALQQRMQVLGDRTHFLIRWRGADWIANADSVKRRQQIVRRFYLLGKTPEQVALNDFLSAARWLKKRMSEETRFELAGSGREAAIVVLAGLICAQQAELPTIQSLHLGTYPLEPSLASCVPGILQVCTFEGLRAAAQGTLQIRELELDAVSPTRFADTGSEPQQANGMRIVEVRENSAKVWVRATRWPLANLGDLPEVAFAQPATSAKRNVGAILPESGVDGLRFAVPGVDAEVRVTYRAAGTGNWKESLWVVVGQKSDYSAVIGLDPLNPGTRYEIRTQVRAVGALNPSSSLTGSFATLPRTDQPTSFRLAVGTCQDFPDRDGPHGFDMYRTMLRRNTDAFVMAGDVVYYDSLARSKQLAYYHWQRTYSLPTLLEFHKRTPTFFLKDDHDTYVNDSWPGNRHDWTGDFTFEAGQEIFIQETGLPNPAYRTFSIGKDLQIWLMEGRDYRSPNNAVDGPQKSIWGIEQKAWLKRTLDASSAQFKVIISPTPLVGPDRDNKRDNHSNEVFATEGHEVRQMIAAHPNTVVVCGDRHWQFHSIDPQTKLHEFSVGPASDRHAGGWKQSDFRPEIHQFLRVGGGYLELDLSNEGERPKLVFRHLDTLGNEQHVHVLQDLR